MDADAPRPDDLPHGLGPNPHPAEPDDALPLTMPPFYGWPSAVSGARQCHECQRWWPPDDVYDFGEHAPRDGDTPGVAVTRSRGAPYPLICVTCAKARRTAKEQ